MFCPTSHKFGLEDFLEIKEYYPTQQERHWKKEASEIDCSFAMGENLPMDLGSASVKMSLKTL